MARTKRGSPAPLHVALAMLVVAAAASALTAEPAGAEAPVVVGTNVNITRLPGNQTEAAIAINPLNPNQLFMASNHDGAPYPAGLAGFRSSDGGQTWTGGVIAGGGADGLPVACCDPSVSWDKTGNLFLSYIRSDLNVDVVALSTDGGASFGVVAQLPARDQPTITTGAGSVWVTFQLNGVIQAAGAPVTGLGGVGPFSPPEPAPGSGGGDFGDIAIGPSGEVAVTYQRPSTGEGPATIFVNVDPDGLGGAGFGPAVAATTTNVGGFDFIPAQPERSIDAEAGLAWDRSGGPATGRLYLIYTDENGNESNDTDIRLRVSDDAGATWLAPTRLNDDATANSQFLPRLALDQTTGNIAATWHDARLDLGTGGPGDVTPGPNNDTRFFGVVGLVQPDATLSFTPNVQISAGTSNEKGGDPPGPGYADIDYGDYTGLAFQSGAFYPAWADNSNSTGDNPDGTLRRFDIYTARVTVGATGAAICAAPPTPQPGDIVGTPGDDTLVGTDGPDRIFGLGGNDRIFGGGGDDVIFGGPGDDSIVGGDGDDILCGGPGNDSLSGGPGDDQLFGEDGNDRLSGDEGSDTLSGGAGDDVLDGGPGSNTNDGGPGNDVCFNPSPGINCSP